MHIGIYNVHSLLLPQANSTNRTVGYENLLNGLENRLAAYYGQRPTLHLRVLFTLEPKFALA
jgi:hypothetical protein